MHTFCTSENGPAKSTGALFQAFLFQCCLIGSVPRNTEFNIAQCTNPRVKEHNRKTKKFAFPVGL